MGKLTISTGPFSIAMLNYQKVDFPTFLPFSEHITWTALVSPRDSHRKAKRSSTNRPGRGTLDEQWWFLQDCYTNTVRSVRSTALWDHAEVKGLTGMPESTHYFPHLGHLYKSTWKACWHPHYWDDIKGFGGLVGLEHSIAIGEQKSSRDPRLGLWSQRLLRFCGL